MYKMIKNEILTASFQGMNNHNSTNETPNEKQPVTVSVQSPAPPLSEAEIASINSEQQQSSLTATDDQEEGQDVLEDPTPPQKLEGKLAGLEPIIGTPQISLDEAVKAGSTHGGLHFPRDHRFTFSGTVADMDQKLQTEIAEWQSLAEASMHQQTENANAFSASNNVTTASSTISQNGAQEEPATGGVTPATVPSSSSNATEIEENHKSAVVRSSSQQREG